MYPNPSNRASRLPRNTIFHLLPLLLLLPTAYYSTRSCGAARSRYIKSGQGIGRKIGSLPISLCLSSCSPPCLWGCVGYQLRIVHCLFGFRLVIVFTIRQKHTINYLLLLLTYPN
ncbi:hypothetical protein F4810DRAFT_687460 [Camillea tinctor]|nr:hypothetical protein F4810DRAFT_687460 [Camillea tinctor]